MTTFVALTQLHRKREIEKKAQRPRRSVPKEIAENLRRTQDLSIRRRVLYPLATTTAPLKLLIETNPVGEHCNTGTRSLEWQERLLVEQENRGSLFNASSYY